MKFTYDGIAYYIEFTYDKNMFLNVQGGRSTEVHILNRYGLPVSYGYSICHPNDQFNKDTGRKIALNRALQHRWAGKENKDVRRAAWDAYFNRRRASGSEPDSPEHPKSKELIDLSVNAATSWFSTRTLPALYEK